MTTEEIIKLAQEAGMRWEGGFTRVIEYVTEAELTRFAALVRNATLEEAAAEADRWQTALHDPRYECDCATAIRALKEMTR